MIKLTNFQKRILKQNLAEIAAKNTKSVFRRFGIRVRVD